MERATTRLRRLLEGPELVVAPGAHDALTARIIESCGFDAVYMSGFGVSGSRLGMPDLGLLTMSEMVDQAANIAACVSLPVIADADTGYGGLLNIERTVRKYEQAGVAAIHIEDQPVLKRCGIIAKLKFVSLEEQLDRIRTALEARTDPDFIIVGRTDILSTGDMAEAVRRGQAMAEAGADMIFIEFLRSEEQIRTVAAEVNAPLMIDVFEVEGMCYLPGEQLREMGYRLQICPVSALLSACAAIRRTMQILKADGSTIAAQAEMESLENYEELLGLGKLLEAGGE